MSASAAPLAFEDFTLGDAASFGAWEMTREAIVAFAQKYDPQAFHLDEAAGARSLLGGLSASGWHTGGVLMRLNCDGWLNRSQSWGGNGVDEIRWLKPVRPGDVLTARRKIIALRASQSRPEMGLVTLDHELVNQDGAPVMTQRNTVMMGRRGKSPEPMSPPAAAAAAPAPPAPPLSGWYEDCTPGARHPLGSACFDAAGIIAFAREFDPQPFHLDEAAARRSHFGGLVASGWHTAACFMRCFVDARHAYQAAALASGAAAPELGPSPGLRDLRWPRPVRPGDRVDFFIETLSRRPTSRPGWGMVEARNFGMNQRGEAAFEFTGNIFFQMRDPIAAA